MKKLLICLSLLPVILASCEAPKPVNKQPNIVMILADDQGWGDLSVNGNTSIATPNIDKLAESGVSLDRFYVCAVCSPTRAEMLTGRYHVRSGVYETSAGKERLDLDETTIGDVFKQAGYATAAYGKWHNGMQAPYHPNSRGFDDFYGFCSGHWGNYFSPMLEHNGEIVTGNGFLTDDLTDHALQFIESHQEEPFFLYLPFNTPHSPMQVPDQYWDKFKDLALPQTGTIPENEKIVHTRAALAMCENIDWNVGRLMEKLDELQLAENTLVIYFSDNGPNGHRWNGGMKGTKGSTDEGGVRSPMFMKWPGTLEAGKKVTQIAGAIDLLPTLADLAGISYESPKPIDGMSLRPLLLENSAAWTGRTIVNHWKGRTSLRTQQYRLSDKGQLFDMVNDPNQTTDIAAEQPEVLQTLMAEKAKWEQEVLSELPPEDTRPFVLGHPSMAMTQVPARDGIAHGNIKRSNRWPNDSYFTNWVDTQDKITWTGEVAESGDFEVEIYYTCPKEAVGTTFELRFGEAKLTGNITEAHDPPATGMEHDRYVRGESYVKDFKALKMGTIHLSKGPGELELVATDIPGSQAMEFRLLTLRRL